MHPFYFELPQISRKFLPSFLTEKGETVYTRNSEGSTMPLTCLIARIDAAKTGMRFMVVPGHLDWGVNPLQSVK